MSRRIDPRVIAVYGRLWRYVLPHKVMGIVAVIAMAATAGIEAAMVMLVEREEPFARHHKRASRLTRQSRAANDS